MHNFPLAVEPKDKSDILHELLNDLKSDLDARKPTISLLQDAITNEIVLTNDVSQVSVDVMLW